MPMKDAEAAKGVILNVSYGLMGKQRHVLNVEGHVSPVVSR